MTSVILNRASHSQNAKPFPQPRKSPNIFTNAINSIPSLKNLQAFNENKILYSSGAYYIGNLEGRKRNGWGKLKSNGCSHEGYYLNGMKDGEGVYTWNDGSLYKGEFKNDLRHGYGELIWPNGESPRTQLPPPPNGFELGIIALYINYITMDTEECDVQTAKRIKFELEEGVHLVTTPGDGHCIANCFAVHFEKPLDKVLDLLDAEFREIFQFILHSLNTTKNYAGNFVDDMRHGFGVYTWPEKGKYEGNFEKNYKHGYGVFTFKNGDVFEGFYKNDQRWGPGIFTYIENAEQDVGIWKGKSLIRVCFVIDDAFLFEHLKHHFINAGNNIPTAIKESTSARHSLRSTQDIVFANCNLESIVNTNSNIPSEFAYEDILDGIRSVRSTQGKLEILSQKLLNASSTGDVHQVKSILEEDLVNANVMDKTGFSSLLAASVNCHTEVINILLDHGANINQLTDEGLSALLACHILLYSEQNFVGNIAEQIPAENLFNTTDIERRSGAVVNRNDRKMIMGMYEETHKPFMGYKKNKAFTRKSSTKNKISVSSGDITNNNSNFDQNSLNYRSSSCYNGGGSPNFSEEEKHEQNRVVLWKVNYYKKSMDHVKDVESINKSFKEVMSDPNYFYNECLKSKHTRHQSLSSDSNLTSCDIDDTDDGSVVHHPEYAATFRGDDDSVTPTNEKDKNKKFFSTTVVSHCGYYQTSVLRTVEYQKKQNNLLVLKCLNNERRPHLQNTVNLLLKRGADPNASNQPMSALFFAVKSADLTAVQALLQQSADTSARLRYMNLSPLHIAVALPCIAGIEITKLLLQYGANPNQRDTFMGGRTPLHITCSREDNYKHAEKIACLLLQYKANPDLLCGGNSPLSLAIASGNDLIIDTLIISKANTSLKMTDGLGSILCVATSFQAERRRTPNERIKLIDKLVKAGADLLTPVRISDKYPPGTVVDYAYHVFYQDRRIAFTPYHALSSIERECFNSRKAMLDKLGRYLREAALRKENELPQYMDGILLESKVIPKSRKQMKTYASAPPATDRDELCGLRFVSIKINSPRPTSQPIVDGKFSDLIGKRLCAGQVRRRLRYCYECGRSIGVRLSACTRCKEVFYCSKGCKVKAWNVRHRDECAKLCGHKSIALQSRGESPTTTSDASHSGANLKSLNIIKEPLKKRSIPSPNFLPDIGNVYFLN